MYVYKTKTYIALEYTYVCICTLVVYLGIYEHIDRRCLKYNIRKKYNEYMKLVVWIYRYDKHDMAHMNMCVYTGKYMSTCYIHACIHAYIQNTCISV